MMLVLSLLGCATMWFDETTHDCSGILTLSAADLHLVGTFDGTDSCALTTTGRPRFTPLAPGMQVDEADTYVLEGTPTTLTLLWSDSVYIDRPGIQLTGVGSGTLEWRDGVVSLRCDGACSGTLFTPQRPVELTGTTNLDICASTLAPWGTPWDGFVRFATPDGAWTREEDVEYGPLGVSSTDACGTTVTEPPTPEAPFSPNPIPDAEWDGLLRIPSNMDWTLWGTSDLWTYEDGDETLVRPIGPWPAEFWLEIAGVTYTVPVPRPTMQDDLPWTVRFEDDGDAYPYTGDEGIEGALLTIDWDGAHLWLDGTCHRYDFVAIPDQVLHLQVQDPEQPVPERITGYFDGEQLVRPAVHWQDGRLQVAMSTDQVADVPCLDTPEANP